MRQAFHRAQPWVLARFVSYSFDFRMQAKPDGDVTPFVVLLVLFCSDTPIFFDLCQFCAVFQCFAWFVKGLADIFKIRKFISGTQLKGSYLYFLGSTILEEVN